MRNILVNKLVPHEVTRPLVHLISFYILGIIGGNIWLNNPSVSPLFYIGIIIGLVAYGIYYDFKKVLLGLLCIGLAIVLFLKFPLHEELNDFVPNKTYQIKGQVEKVKVTNYYKWLTLKNVEVLDTKEQLKSRVQIRIPLEYEVSSYDEIEAKGICTEVEPQMNPSDLDYQMYLKGQKVVATFKLQALINHKENTPWIELIQNMIINRLEKLFSPSKVGIMEAVILGEDTKLDQQTNDLYQAAGISHVLCISGFHIGVVISALMILCQRFPMHYNFKQIILIIAVWIYVLLTGYGTSTVRAAMMVTIGLVGKCLWQEDDGVTNLAIAALVILMINPYQLFMAGFQLSFMAVLGIILCLREIEKKELYIEWKYKKWIRTLLTWMSVQFFTWPIIAYHFFEVPFIASLCNMAIIPIFSVIIIMGWVLILLSFMPLPIAYVGSWLIEVILDGITKVVTWIIKFPLASVCTGRPSFFEYMLYFGVILLLSAIMWGYCKKIRLYQGLILVGCCYCMNLLMQPKNLRITSLYVGQGDCTIIEMPHYGVFIIDGGDFGNGEVIENYIKYLGYNKIQGIMVSHSDSDHIGGILEVLEMPIEVEQVFISESDTSENLQNLKEQCQQEMIPIYALNAGEQVQYSNIEIKCIAPDLGGIDSDNNENSIVCKLIYNNFSVLFTGDQSKSLMEDLFEEQEHITLLKVSHHGSRTGTSQDMLLKLQPKYAMISCGRNNCYGHPHQEVLALLEESGVEVNRTDIEGTICYETDGKYIKKTSYRKDA